MTLILTHLNTVKWIIIITAICHTIFYVYPTILFTKWAMNDTTMTRVGLVRGLYFQMACAGLWFGVMLLITIFAWTPTYFIYIDAGLVGAGILTL